MTEPPPEDPFFIGWLPMPDTYRRFLGPIATVLLLLAVSVAVSVAFVQRNPGKGTWETGHVQTFQGIAYDRPYALIRVPGAKAGDPPRTLLLVEQGKFGALPRVEPLVQGQAQGQAVQVSGTLLQRDGRAMLELAEGEASLRKLTPEEERQLPLLERTPPQLVAEAITLDGEIVDPKCYLGAMKPGTGKTHKSCAMLCISGGIPPMLVTRDGEGRSTYHLLTTADGGPANDPVLPYVGDAVTVTGRLERQDDLLLLRLAPGGVKRR